MDTLSIYWEEKTQRDGSTISRLHRPTAGSGYCRGLWMLGVGGVVNFFFQQPGSVDVWLGFTLKCLDTVHLPLFDEGCFRRLATGGLLCKIDRRLNLGSEPCEV